LKSSALSNHVDLMPPSYPFTRSLANFASPGCVDVRRIALFEKPPALKPFLYAA